MAETFTNWSQSIVITPEKILRPKNVEEVVRIVRDAKREGKTLHAYGSGWSFSDIMAATGYMVNTEKLDGIFRFSQAGKVWNPHPSVDRSDTGFGKENILPDGLRESIIKSNRKFVWVGAGARIRQLYEALDNPTQDVNPSPTPRSRWALPTMGGASGQTLAGVISTATHGGDFNLPPIADMVRAIHLVGPDGELYWIERSGDHAITDRSKMLAGLTKVNSKNLRYDDDWFFSTLVSLGALGIICSYIIEVVDQFGLSERSFETTWNRIKPFIASGEIFRTTKFDRDRPPWIQAHPDAAGKTPQGIGLFINPYRKSYDIKSPEFNDRRVILVTHARSSEVGSKHKRPAGDCSLIQAFKNISLIHHFEHTSDPSALSKLVDSILDSLREPQGTHKYPVSYSVLDTTSSEDRQPILSLEVVVSTDRDRHIAYLDHIFQIFDDTMDELRRKYGAARFAGGINIRFTKPTVAYLGMQHPISNQPQDERFCHIEIIVMREQWVTGKPLWGEGSDYSRNEMENFTEIWTDRFERAAGQFGARLHWGQLSRTRNHDPHRYKEFGKWQKVREQLTQDGSINTFDNNFVMRHIPTWQRIPGGGRDIAIGGVRRISGPVSSTQGLQGVEYVIGTDIPAPGNGGIWKYDNRNWHSIGGFGTRIAVDPQGHWWIVNSAGEIWGPGGRKPGRGRDISIGANGTVWVIGTDNPAPGNGGTYRWEGNQWRYVQGYGVAIAVAPNGQPWVVRADGTIWRLLY